MKILVVEPGKKPYPKEISGSLESMQEIVGGYIQAVYPFDDMVAIVCDDESKLKGCDLNRALRDESGNIYDIISGTFFICGLSEFDFSDLSEELMEKYTKKFLCPEGFARVNGRLTAYLITEE